MMDEQKILAIEYNRSHLAEISEIAKSLTQFGITCFGLVRIFNNGKWLVTGSHQPWVDNFIKKIQYNPNYLTVIEEEIARSNSCVQYANSQRDLTVESYAELHAYNLWNGLNIYDIQPTYIEYCYFLADPASEQISNFYLQHLDLLKQFINYFKVKATDFINVKKEDMLINVCQPLNIDFKKIKDDQKQIDAFLQTIQLDKYELNSKFNKIVLTKRQLECALHYVKGNTAKETARFLNISPRTVESYIHTIKSKFAITYKSELRDIINDFKKSSKIILDFD